MNPANILALVQHFAAMLSTFGEKAGPILDLLLKLLTSASPLVGTLFPQVAPFLTEITAALTFLKDHGPEVVEHLDGVFKLLGSLGDVVGKLVPSTNPPAA